MCTERNIKKLVHFFVTRGVGGGVQKLVSNETQWRFELFYLFIVAYTQCSFLIYKKPFNSYLF